MGSIQRQDSFDSDDHRLDCPDDLLEARTLTSKEMQRAREEALYVLKTKTPEEAFKIFTQGLIHNVESPVGPGEANGAESARPPAETETEADNVNGGRASKPPRLRHTTEDDRSEGEGVTTGVRVVAGVHAE